MIYSIQFKLWCYVWCDILSAFDFFCMTLMSNELCTHNTDLTCMSFISMELFKTLHR